MAVALFLIFSQEAVEFFNQGEEYYKQGDYTKAIYFYRKSLEDNPYFKKPVKRLAEIYITTGELEEAGKWVEKLLSLEPLSSEAKIMKARIELMKGNYRQAQDILKDILKNDPANLEARYWYAYLLYSMGDLKGAEKELSKNLKLGKHFKTTLLLSIVHWEQGFKSKAKEELEDAIEENPDNPWPYIYLGQMYQQENKTNVAVSFLEKARSIKPKDLQILNLLAFAYLNIKKYEKTIESLKNLIKLVPEHPLANYNLGYALFQSGRKTEAVQKLFCCLNLKPYDEICRMMLENIAREVVEPTSEERLRLAEWREKQGRDYWEKGDWEKAWIFFRMAVKNYPQDPELRKNLARALLQLKRYPECLKELAIVLELDPDQKSKLAAVMDKIKLKWEATLDYKYQNFPSPKRIKLYISPLKEKPWEVLHMGLGKVWADTLQFLMEPESKFELTGSDYDYKLEGVIWEGNNNIGVKLRLFEVRTGKVVWQFENNYAGLNAFSESVIEVYKKLKKEIPFEADVVDVANGKIYINAGTDHGIKEGKSYQVIRYTLKSANPLLESPAGKIKELIGEVQIIKAGRKISIGKMTPGKLVKVTIGDKVVIR